MLPSDLDLPGKFTEWRPNQLELSAKIAASSKYGYLLDSPTGTGKSLVAAAAQRLLQKNAVYLCATKQLQQQILNDFPYSKTLMGRANYRCLKYPRMFPRISAEDCTHSEDRPCDRRGGCPYIIAKQIALRAPLAVLNTSYFLSEANYVGAFTDIKFLVVDELDALESQLMGYIQLSVTKKQLDRINVAPPKYKTKFECWVEWANEMLKQLMPELDRLTMATEQTGDWGGIDVSMLKRKGAIARLVSKLKFFVKEVDSTWVPFYGEEEWTFKPVWVSKYATGVLWKHANKVLGMSATILDPRQLSSNIGLTYGGERTYEYKALPSPFPKEHRPVYFEPCANIINRNMEEALPKLARAVERIMEKHSNEKILVHVVSYRIRDYLMKNISSSRLVSHDTATRASALEGFKKSERPLVLLSPSMERGVDLPGEECRVIIIAKVPYPDLGDAQINKRIHASKDGNSWYAHRTVSSIVQMSGRAVRSKDDWAACVAPDTRVLASNLTWVHASSLKPGDEVLCFDEEPVEGVRRHFRYWRRGTVTASGTNKEVCTSIKLADGTALVSTTTHRWLIRVANSVIWEYSKNLHAGSELLRFIHPWNTGVSFAHGWLSGFADGEGTYSPGLGKRNPNVQAVVLTQNPGLALEKAKHYLDDLGFRYSYFEPRLYINGGIQEKLRFLGEVRPVRLLNKFKGSNFCSMLKAAEVVPVASINLCVSDITTLQIDKATYFAEGFGAHNTYILDEQFSKLYREWNNMFPAWYKEAVIM